MMQAELDVEARSGTEALKPVEDEIDQISKRVRKLEDEMHGNVKTMNNIKDKLEVLMKIDHVDDKVAHPVIGLPPVEPKAQQQRAEAQISYLTLKNMEEIKNAPLLFLTEIQTLTIL